MKMDNENIEVLENNMVYAMSKFVQGTVSGEKDTLATMETTLATLTGDVIDFEKGIESLEDSVTTLTEQELKLSVANGVIRGDLTDVKEQSDLNMDELVRLDSRITKVEAIVPEAHNLMLDDGSDVKQVISELRLEMQSVKDAMVMLREAFENLLNFGF
tara:strand:+ start:160 stop:636 length:477 start_codon:yes stop_codon:yes gene_type:complete